MAQQIKDLQKLIEERAAKRLREDIRKLSDVFCNQTLFKDLPEVFKIKTLDGKSTEIPQYFFYWSYPFMKQLEDYWLPKYIEQESKELLEKVDSLREDIDNLTSHLPC